MTIGLTVVGKSSTTVKQRGEAGCTHDQVRSRRNASPLGWADRSDAACVASAPDSAGVEQEGAVLTKYVVGRDCNAVATTKFIADVPRSTVSNRGLPAKGPDESFVERIPLRAPHGCCDDLKAEVCERLIESWEKLPSWSWMINRQVWSEGYSFAQLLG